MTVAARASARSSPRRKLFAPSPLSGPGAVAIPDASASTDGDAALAAALSAADSVRSYSLRRRTPKSSAIEGPDQEDQPVASSSSSPQRRSSMRTGASQRSSAQKRPRAITPSDDDSGSDSGSNTDDDADSDAFSDAAPRGKPLADRNGVTPSPTKKSSKTKVGKSTTITTTTRSSSQSAKKVTKSPSSPFDVSPRKKQKPIKVNLEEHEAHPAPPRWEVTYAILAKQRTKIVAPVDTMGCEENGREDRRADAWREPESAEEAARRERLSTLVSLMLSSQTKDPVTAEAVYNLQRTLPSGLCLQSLLDADDETISSCIAKVGFWRRKTGYLKSAARILASDFDGDVPKTVDELCSLPGVGPKMAFLALSSMGIQVGIGVDTHVHRMTNRLGWHKTTTPEQTRLNLQSWLPQELHGKINRLLVGFGQVICVPVGPRCDLCDVGKAGLCPSFRDVDAKSALKRVKVELLDSDDESIENKGNWVKVRKEPSAASSSPEPKVKVEVEIDGPHGAGLMRIDDLQHAPTPIKEELHDGVKVEDQDGADAATVEKALDW
ncbi:DNA glycosylase [Testicularia cyperi]|uniref:Endonuclease III homolog n=1 Tax=Testicularia cyperi TaxID=1882483 RepID=A0A317XMZ7_9BASI|nr:DNA glycosylase [Testicularia cyperi]